MKTVRIPERSTENFSCITSKGTYESITNGLKNSAGYVYYFMDAAILSSSYITVK